MLADSFGPTFQLASMFAVLTRYSWYGRNVWLEPSGVVAMFGKSPYAEQLAWVCRAHGLDRVLWASDYPFYSPDESMTGLRGLGFSDAELDQVLVWTATELFGL